MPPKRETALQLWGRELAHAREAAGMTGKQLAEAAYLGHSTIGMWETGKRTPNPKDLQRCEVILRTNGYLGRLLTKWVSREISPEWLEWIRVEERADTLLSHEPSVLPGLVQTAEYAEAVLAHYQGPFATTEERVQARLERQGLLDREDPPMTVFTVDEHVLYRSAGGPKVMTGQLRRLLELSERPHVFIHIVPKDTEYYPGLVGAFVIAKLDGTEVAYQDGARRGEILENHYDVAALGRVWQNIQSVALTKAASIELIAKAEEWWTK